MRNSIRGIVLAVCCMAAASVLPIAAGEPDQRAAGLIKAQAEMLEAFRLHDTAALDRLLAADYLTVNSDGSFSDKPKTLAFVKSGGLPIQSWVVEDRHTRFYGDVAVIVSSSLVNGKIRVRHTEVWIRNADQWKFVSWQGTEVY